MIGGGIFCVEVDEEIVAVVKTKYHKREIISSLVVSVKVTRFEDSFDLELKLQVRVQDYKKTVGDSLLVASLILVESRRRGHVKGGNIRRLVFSRLS